MYKYTENMFLY